jgi:drug/metabolite transporter (DMT)-like permease
MDTKANEFRGTLIGCSAILMWATLAALTSFCKEVPPFLMTGVAFTVASAIGVGWMKRQGHRLVSLLRIPLRGWLLGVFGLFGFHLFYFIALKHAPILQASLIVYLWPLLIVILSALLPGERLRWNHLVGTMAGLLGAGLIVTGGASFCFNSGDLPGYAFAFLCALTWSSYSVLSRALKGIPTYAISGFCAITALLAFICHALFEPALFPSGAGWLALVGLGLGPVGGAFFTWDVGVKSGNIKVLGALSYASPLLSTLLLLAMGLAQPSWLLAVASLLIVIGALLASGDFLKRYEKYVRSGRDA